MWGYPSPRERNGRPAAALSNQFRSRQTSAGFVVLGDTAAEVLVFSGRPDRVEVIVELFDAIVSLRERASDEADEITLRAGQSYVFRQRGARVFGRNATAGSNARLQVIGEWV